MSTPSAFNMGNSNGTYQLPPGISTVSSEVDWLYYFIFWSSVAFFVAIVLTMTWFGWRYRYRGPGPAPQSTGDHTKLELAWTFSPLIFLVFLFHWGFQGYVKAAVAPPDTIDIRVRGMQWNWEFEYPNGMVQLNELVVPVHKPVRLLMSSSDVLHSFFVPAFRLKKDVVPGMYTTMWFEATKVANAQVFCTEYCGAPEEKDGNVGHSNMLAMIKVVPQAQYDDFLSKGPAIPDGITPAQWGAQLFAKNQCNTCHGVDGVATQPAPNLKGLLGRKERFSDGAELVADENYIRESILNPQKRIVAGYTNVVMPMFRMPDRQIDAIILYIKGLN